MRNLTKLKMNNVSSGMFKQKKRHLSVFKYTKHIKDFDFARKPSQERFPMLTTVLSSLGTVFPGTLPVEAHSLLLKWSKNDLGDLTDFFLEGILCTKQL